MIPRTFCSQACFKKHFSRHKRRHGPRLVQTDPKARPPPRYMEATRRVIGMPPADVATELEEWLLGRPNIPASLYGEYEALGAMLYTALAASLSPTEGIQVGPAVLSRVECHARAISHNPTWSATWLNLGASLSTDDLDASVRVGSESYTRAAAFAEALRLAPRDPTAWVSVASAMGGGPGETVEVAAPGKPGGKEAMGREQLCVRALEIDAACGPAWVQLASCLPPPPPGSEPEAAARTVAGPGGERMGREELLRRAVAADDSFALAAAALAAETGAEADWEAALRRAPTCRHCTPITRQLIAIEAVRRFPHLGSLGPHAALARAVPADASDVADAAAAAREAAAVWDEMGVAVDIGSIAAALAAAEPNADADPAAPAVVAGWKAMGEAKAARRGLVAKPLVPQVGDLSTAHKRLLGTFRRLGKF